MSESSWDAYTAEDTASAPEPVVELDAAALEADITPILDVAATDAWQGDNATSWGEYNQEIADEAATYAAEEVEYAAELYAAGFEGAGDAALARAEISLDTASDHAATASDYDVVAESEYEAAADGYSAVADVIADPSDYTTTSYDTTVADTSAYDTTSLDTSTYDTTSVDTTSYDTTSYDTSATDVTE